MVHTYVLHFYEIFAFFSPFLFLFVHMRKHRTIQFNCANRTGLFFFPFSGIFFICIFCFFVFLFVIPIFKKPFIEKKFPKKTQSR